MKKIPTLFERVFQNHKLVGITEKPIPGMEWVLDGLGEATIKYDGACCALLNGKFYKRYDAKRGKQPPEGAIPCCPPDPVTGHWPHWVPVDPENPADQWFIAALQNTQAAHEVPLVDATYEAVGPHFQGNPYFLSEDKLYRHGDVAVSVARTFDGIQSYLATHPIEGLVFWKDGEPQCKIKRSDFGLPWPAQR